MQGRGSKPRLYRAGILPRKSPLMQGRGSKRLNSSFCRRGWAVAPHAGAWIETRSGTCRQGRARSPLMQGRGSKTGDLFPVGARAEVAPKAGAGGETARGGERIDEGEGWADRVGWRTTR